MSVAFMKNGKAVPAAHAGKVKWDDMENKPFSGYDTSDFDVDDNELLTLSDTVKNKLQLIDNTISDEWDPAKGYKAEEYCIYNNILWKCKLANTNVPPSESTQWTACKVASEFSALNTKLDKNIADLYNSSFTTSGLTFVNCTYVSGGYVKIGNIVIIELRVKINTSVAQWGNVISGLPNAGGREVPLSVKNTSGSNTIELDVNNTNIRLTSSKLSNISEVNISGVYIKQ